jgi:hypothetical protein
MDEPRLFKVNQLPSLDGIEQNKLYKLLDNPGTFDDFVSTVVLRVADNTQVNVTYSFGNVYDKSLFQPGCLSCIVFFSDFCDNAFISTNLDEEKLNYKEYNKCKLFIGSALNSNIIYYRSDYYSSILGNVKCSFLRININSADIKPLDLIPSDKYQIYNIESSDVVLNSQDNINYEFIDIMLRENLININYKEIVKTNGLVKLREFSEIDMKRIKEFDYISNIDDIKEVLNPFFNKHIINKLLTPITCNWILEIIKPATLHMDTLHLHPSETEVACSFLKYVIDKFLLDEVFKLYNISNDVFSMDILNMVYHNINQHEKINYTSNLVIDIVLSDMNDETGYFHTFKDGTVSRLNKGDCIIYADKLLQTPPLNGTLKLMRIGFTLNLKKKQNILVY